MNIKIYYFSGTGNSFAVARDIAGIVKADLISIPKAMGADRIRVDADCMGIVFPSYLAPVAGLPLIVERFVGKIENIDSIHIFAVCTCGGYECVNALAPLNKLSRIVSSRGGKVFGEYSMRLPMNNLDYSHIPVPITKDTEKIVGRSKAKAKAISRGILKKKGTRYKFAKKLFLLLMTPLYYMMRQPIMDTLREKAKAARDAKLAIADLVALSDKSIAVDDKLCTGCGACAKVCPVGNIEIVGKRPQFQHRCEMCFACDEWCPCGAIQHWSRHKGIKYHYPEVKISDMNQ